MAHLPPPGSPSASHSMCEILGLLTRAQTQGPRDGSGTREPCHSLPSQSQLCRGSQALQGTKATRGLNCRLATLSGGGPRELCPRCVTRAPSSPGSRPSPTWLPSLG